MGLRLHPNSNVMDGYAGASSHGEQRDVRFSRALRPRTNDLAVGPFRLEIVEPMNVQRVRLGRSGARPRLRRQPARQRARILRDPPPAGPARSRLQRRAPLHAGSPGERRADDRRRARAGRQLVRLPRPFVGNPLDDGAVRPDRRPREGDGRPARAAALGAVRMRRAPSGFFHCHEAHDGSVLDCEGRLHRAGKPPLRIDAVQHALRYESGTRRLAGGDLTLVDEEGTGHEYRFEVACPPAHPQGYGYTRGWSDGGQPGVFRGPRRDRARPLRRLRPGRSRPVRCTCRRSAGSAAPSSSRRSPTPDGAEGMAHVEHMLYPPRPPRPGGAVPA